MTVSEDLVKKYLGTARRGKSLVIYNINYMKMQHLWHIHFLFFYCSHFTKAQGFSGLCPDSSFRRVPNNASKLFQNHCQVQLLLAYCLNILCILPALLKYDILDRLKKMTP